MCWAQTENWSLVYGLEPLSAVEPISAAILTGTQVEFGTDVGTTEKGERVCT